MFGGNGPFHRVVLIRPGVTLTRPGVTPTRVGVTLTRPGVTLNRPQGCSWDWHGRIMDEEPRLCVAMGSIELTEWMLPGFVAVDGAKRKLMVEWNSRHMLEGERRKGISWWSGKKERHIVVVGQKGRANHGGRAWVLRCSTD